MTESNELWQIDIKGPFRLEHEEHYAIFGLDDYFRFLVYTELMESTPTTEDVKIALRKSFKEYGKPERVLMDRGPQFREKFKEFCEEEGIEVEQAPPHYPQIKGKIERSIRNSTGSTWFSNGSLLGSKGTSPSGFGTTTMTDPTWG